MNNEANVFQKHVAGSSAFSEDPLYPLQDGDLPLGIIRKTTINLPDLSEREVVRHYSILASRMFHLDQHFYPLGSCTMKYNPKINEEIARDNQWNLLHPLQDEADVQGALRIFYELQERLKEITGMDAFTLQPAAGAHGEFTALLVAKKYFEKFGGKRDKIVVPDSSHGTNPASAAFAGFRLVTIPSKNGEVDLDALKQECDGTLAVFMLTNPNTLGLFEKNVSRICRMVRDCGGLSYLDGANMNALLGISKPAAMGFDMMHINLHKTFGTPHGGGGPGSGPVGVRKSLEGFLPVPYVSKKGDTFSFSFDRSDTIGAVKAFWGNFGVILKANIYLDALGQKGLQETSLMAILNANYLRKKLSKTYHVPYDRVCMHEFVMTPDSEKSPAKTLDIAKRLLDYGIHAPTIYFPLIVKESMMIEPTETENKDTLDAFVKVMETIANEAKNDADKLHDAPVNTFRSRLDEVKAARFPVLKWEANN